MNQYTEFLMDQARELSSIEDDYERQLRETASSFRDFGTALTYFIVDHGYKGDPSNVTEKSEYLRKCYKESQIQDPPRDFKKWFSPGYAPKRATVFPLLFALKLDIEESNDFFRRVQFERSFDCHTATEAVFYFCIKNKLSYTEAKEAISQIQKKIKSPIPKQDVLFTKTVVDHLDSIRDLSGVISYISENQSDFDYNNVTAAKIIRELWSEIKGENGLATLEGELIDSLNSDRGKDPSKNSEEEHVIEQKMFEDDFVIANADASTWTIYSQILGLDNYTSIKQKNDSNRALSSIIKNNVLLPLRASDCFPNRQSIDAVLRGDAGDNETFRKILILLSFYVFWAKITIEHKDLFWGAKGGDNERCEYSINAYLLEAGYPELYAGNPYDWIFLWSMNDDTPLPALRCYIGEILAVNSETTNE